ncbi:hypothetical protein [Acinetobacter baumannii]|uniref:hypothetical protein n=1 Tax=Acinetobacter baumannii TaxID=470 RepID=UPI0038912B5A
MSKIEYSLLHQRLGLGPQAIQDILKIYLRLNDLCAEIPTIEECEKFFSGEEVINFQFIEFLQWLDIKINKYAKDILDKYQPREYIRLLTCKSKEELWEHHSTMKECPLELHNTIINRITILANYREINVKYDNIKNEEKEEYDSWGNTNKLELPIKEYIKNYLEQIEQGTQWRSSYKEDWTMS